MYADKKITQEDIIKFYENTGRTGDTLDIVKYQMNPKNEDSSISQELRVLEKEKEAEKQYLALLKKLKKDHNVTVLDYEYGNPQNKRQRIIDYLFKFSGEAARANVIMARPFIDPAGEAIINIPVSLPYSQKLRKLNEELFHVGQFRDEQLTGKPTDRLKNVKYLLPKGIRGLIPSDPNVKFVTKGAREALEDFIGYKLGTRPTQYGRYDDPEAIEGIHRSYQQSEDYLKQFGLSTTDPESFTYRHPKSEYFFENPRKQYAGFAKGGDIKINDLPEVCPIPDVGSIRPITPLEAREAFGGPLYQILNPSGQRLVDRMGLRGKGVGGFFESMVGPGGKFKLSKNAMNKIKPLLQQRKRELDLSQNIDPVERAAAQKNVKQIEKQIDKIIRDDQS